MEDALMLHFSMDPICIVAFKILIAWMNCGYSLLLVPELGPGPVVDEGVLDEPLQVDCGGEEEGHLPHHFCQTAVQPLWGTHNHLIILLYRYSVVDPDPY